MVPKPQTCPIAGTKRAAQLTATELMSTGAPSELQQSRPRPKRIAYEFTDDGLAPNILLNRKGL